MPTIGILKALSDESRLGLALTLSGGTFSGQELAYVHEISQPTASHHLKILQTSGVVKSKKQAQWIHYSLNTDGRAAKLISQILEAAAEDDEWKSHSSKARIKLVQERRKEKNRDFFNKVAPEWNTIRARIHGETSHLLSTLNNIPNMATVLEVGCGNGLLLKDLCNRGGVTIGVDSSEAMLSEARKNAPRADLRLGYLEHLPIADQSVDVAVASLVFHHVTDRQTAIADIERVLKPGGKLLIFDRVDSQSGEFGEDFEKQFNGLWFSFSPEELLSELANVGLKKQDFLEVDGGEYFILTAIKST